MYHRLAGNEPGLVGYWSLDKGSGNIATDKTDSANDGTLNGATWQQQIFLQSSQTQQSSSQSTQTQQSSSQSDQTTIRFQSALVFDGKNTCVTLGKKPEFKIEKNITLEAWVYAENPKGISGIISNAFDSGSTESGYGLLFDSPSGVFFALKTQDQEMRYVSSGIETLKLQEWQHIAATYDGQQIKVYVNGVEKTTKDVDVKDSPINYKPENDLLIGMFKDDNETIPFKGKIAEVRLWNRVRSSEEIKQDMNRHLQGNESGLVGYWPLNEGSGDTVKDLTSRGNHGTINAPTWQQ